MTGAVPDQHALWSGRYDATEETIPPASAFVGECLPLIPPASRILELGCGAGADAAVPAAHGHAVTATDFVASVIVRNRTRYDGEPRLAFREMRIDSPFPFGDASFDAVYAHLTLHYFTYDATTAIFREIHRVLRLGGVLMFGCKSDRDPLYGRGVAIEPDIFDLDGHVRHFFSESYARACLEAGFTLDRLASRSGDLHGNPSAWITAIAHAQERDVS